LLIFRLGQLDPQLLATILRRRPMPALLPPFSAVPSSRPIKGQLGERVAAQAGMIEEHRTFGRSRAPPVRVVGDCQPTFETGPSGFNCRLTIVSVNAVRDLIGNQLVERLVELDVLVEIADQARNRRFRYDPYIALFVEERGQV
jgi:hypothetical protein